MSQSERLTGMTDAKEFNASLQNRESIQPPCRPPPCNQPRPPPQPCVPHPSCSCTRPDCREVVEVNTIKPTKVK